MRGIVVVRNLITDANGNTVPQAPGAWDIQVEDNDWYTLWPRGREAHPDIYLHARLMVTRAGQGAFMVIGPDAWLAQLAQMTDAWTLAELRADNGAVATAIKSGWKDDRVRDNDGNVANPLEPIVRLRWTMAGYDHPADCDATTSVPT